MGVWRCDRAGSFFIGMKQVSCNPAWDIIEAVEAEMSS